MTYEQRIRCELERVCGTEEWICVHSTPSDHEAFEVGSVVRIGSDVVIMNTVDTQGRNNGSRAISLENVFGITVGTPYLETLRILRDHLPTPRYVDSPEPSPEGTLRAAQSEGLAVNLRLEDETVSEFVNEVGEGWTAIEQIEGDTGEGDGVRIVSLEGVERVFVGGEDEMRLGGLARAYRLRHSIG